MNNKLKLSFLIISIIFIVLYLSQIGMILLGYFNVDTRMFNLYMNIVGRYTLIGFFFFLVIEAYFMKTKREMFYSIVFLIFVGLILLYPPFVTLPIFFLIVYSYYRSIGSNLDIPLSFVTVGYFCNMYLPYPIGLLGIVLVIMGWLKYFTVIKGSFNKNKTTIW